MTLLTLVVGSLAVWRLSHALVKESGPLMVFARLRARLASHQERSGGLFDVISCVYCLSFWVGLIASLWVAGDVFEWFVYGLAFSAIAMIIESAFTKQTA
jgi:hypothetical protein